MECPYAYIKENVNYILCECEGQAKTSEMKEIAKKLCLHQRFCRKVNKCSLLPTWRECKKINQNAK